MKERPGKVYIVGAGPGDPGLLTVKALECIKKAEVIVYDRLISKDILRHRRPGCALKYVGKGKGDSSTQNNINNVLLKCAGQYGMVLRLKGGDPFIFGRGSEEALFLKGHGISFEIVPGVSSFYSVAEICGIPLTHRGVASSFLVATGHEDPTKGTSDVDWKHVARFTGSVVIMMGVATLAATVKKLIAGGRRKSELCAVISNGTTDRQKTVVGSLGDIANKAKGLSSPAVVVIGPVVGIGFELNPGMKPLAGNRYLSTASRELSDEISEKLALLGARVDCVPMIKVLPHRDRTLLDSVIRGVRKFDRLVFTSRYGAGHFLKRYRELSAPVAALGGRIACVGKGTSGVFEEYGIKPALIPNVFTTKDLGLALIAQAIRGKNIALLRTKMKRDPLKKMLMKAGAKVTDCLVYDIEDEKDPEGVKKALSKAPDGIVFMSPRSTEVFFNIVPKAMADRVKKNVECFSIGPVTTGALRRRGLLNVREPREYTIDGIVKACAGRN